MAEQEACAQIVADAVRGEPTTPTTPPATSVVKQQSTQGECLLLPLLQGLLDRPHDQHRHLNKLQEDEELLKLTSSLDGELLDEVRAALARLQAALKAPATDVSSTKRRALLALAARLQAGLLVPPTQKCSVVPNDKLDGCENLKKISGRYARRSRQARHTVGVSREELADARRLMEDDDVRESLNSNETENKKPTTTSPRILQKQLSCDAVLVGESKDSPVINTTPVSLNSILKVSITTQPLPESTTVTSPNSEVVSFHSAATIRQKPAPVIQSANLDASPVKNRNSIPNHTTNKGPSSKTVNHSNFSNKIHNSILKAAQRKSMEEISIPNGNDTEDSDLEEPVTFKNMKENTPINHSAITNGIFKTHNALQEINNNNETPLFKSQMPSAKVYNDFDVAPKSYNVVSSNIFSKEVTNGANSDNEQQTQRTSNRFCNKRTRMKRANTIDIPKPNSFYRMDSDASDDEHNRTSNGHAVKPKVPVFQPKTENDHKFLAFINKHNDNNNSPLWSPNNVNNAPSNWSNCFGNIKNAFENHSHDYSRSSSSSSARKFWKMTDDHVISKPPTDFGLRFNKMGNKNFVSPRENKTKFGKLPWTSETKGDIVTGTLKVAPPNLVDTVGPDPKKYMAKPIPVNQFSHAPLSAFKPPSSKMPMVSPTSGPSPHIWSPPSLSKPTEFSYNDPPQYTQYNNHLQQAQKIPQLPVNIPWSQRQSRDKVLNLALKKFEHPVVTSQMINTPHFKERVFAPLTSQEPPKNPIFKRDIPKELPNQGALSAPQLVRKMESLKQKFEPIEYENDRIAKLDAQKLQIEFYEKQILEKHKKKPSISNGFQHRRFSDQISPQNYTYTVTDYTPPQVSTFTPLQQTPDIEKIKSHDAEKLPDVVLNDSNPPNQMKYASKHHNSSPISTESFNDRYSRNKGYSDTTLEPLYDPYSNIHHNHIVDYDNSCGKDILDSFDEFKPVEYQAVSKVMRGPVSQQAVIKTNVMKRNADEQRNDAAKSLKGVLSLHSSPKSEVLRQIENKKVSDLRYSNPHSINAKIPQFKHQPTETGILKVNAKMSKVPQREGSQNNVQNHLYNFTREFHNSDRQNVPIINYEGVISPKVQSNQRPPFGNYEFKVRNNVFSRSPPNDFAKSNDSLDMNDETGLHSKLQLHPANSVKRVSPLVSPISSTPSPTALSKSESWHQLTQQQMVTSRPSPHSSPSSKSTVTRAKSLHLLSLPKQFEGSIDKDKISEKRRTVEAYFSGSVSPQPLSKSSSQQAIADVNGGQLHTKQVNKSKCKQTAKVSSQSQSFSLGRSQTMPHIGVNDVMLLDESNVDDAFENLVKEVLP